MSELIIIIALVLFNGVLAMSEIALISVRKSHLSNEAKNGSKSAIIALKLVNNPDNFLSTVQIGITIIGILTGIYSGSVLADDFSVFLTNIGISTSYSHILAQSIIVVVVAYLTLIFGELIPKRIGMCMSEKAVKMVARPMYTLSLVASPFVWLLSKSTSSFMNLIGVNTSQNKVTEEEIKLMVRDGARDGEVQDVEQDIVERVFIMGDLKVNSLMTHRSDVIALDISMTNIQIQEVLKRNFYEVYPVIDKTLDNVKGVVTLKDLVFKFNQPDFNLTQVLTKASYFHENMNVYKVLEEMKQQRISQALICDEFGSCAGIITLKDILEGLVGSMEDAHSEPDIMKRQIGDGWLIDGQCPFYDFLSYFEQENLYSACNSYNTIGGFILEYLQHIPKSGEFVEWNGFKLEIVDMDGARIDKVLATKT